VLYSKYSQDPGSKCSIYFSWWPRLY